MKTDTSLGEVIFLLLMCWFLYQCVFTSNVEDTGHQVFVKMGVDEIIHEWDRQIQR